MMKKTDKEIFDMLETELEKSSESIEIPLRLRKESVVKMLKENQNKEKDFSAETGTNNKIVVLRRLTAVAAALIVVVVAALFMKTGGVRVVKTDTFYKGYESVEPVKGARSYEEVEKAVLEILDSKKSQADVTNADNSNQSSTQGVIDRLIEGYSNFVAEGKATETSEYSAETSKAAANQGVVSYGDFSADIVKTDGEYLYIVATDVDPKTGAPVEQIKIVKAAPAQEMAVVSTIVLANGTSAGNLNECIEIHLRNNRLIALMSSYTLEMEGSAAYNKASTVALYYDISEPSAPVKLREHKQEGSYISSGFCDNKLTLVTHVSISAAAAKSAEESGAIIPAFEVDGVEEKLTAGEIFIAVNDPEASFLFVTVTDTEDLTKSVGRLAILGSGKDVYCLDSTVAIARGFVSVETDSKAAHSSLTEIYRFEISGSEIVFAGSYIVQGSLTGGISADNESGNLKVLTCDSGANNFYIFNKKMEFVSGLKGILPNEKIKSVKYIGNNAYFVAGEDNEKTVIVDLSDVSKPKAAGNISTEGFSRELYAVSDTALFGVLNGEDGSVSIVLFDVSNPSSPKTVSAYILEGDFILPSEGDGRCVLLDSGKMIFGIPVVNSNPETKVDVSSYVLFKVDGGEIKPIGTYNHDTACTGDAAVRGVCIGDTLYTVSSERISAFDINECTLISSQTIR